MTSHPGPEPATSILFEHPEEAGAQSRAAPPYFDDLNLDVVTAAILEGHSGFGLEGLLWTPLADREDVTLRQGVFRDLDSTPLFTHLKAFTDAMAEVRDHLGRAGRAGHPCEQQRWHLDAAVVYCRAVPALDDALRAAEPRSRGLGRAAAYLHAYARSGPFTDLTKDTREASTALAEVTYCVSIEGGRVEVSPFRGEPDYRSEVDKAFARFAPAAPEGDEELTSGESSDEGVDHVEARVLDLVARHFPEAFSGLERFSREHHDFVDARLKRLEREAHFYMAVLEFVEKLRSAGLAFCYPEVVDRSDQLSVSDGFDLALAGHLIEGGRPVVRNDFHFRPGEHIFVVTGPNQGGKTTFARMVGQVHHLAALGGPVPGTVAKVPLCDMIFTHFARQERPSDRRGALEDDLVRAHSVLRSATSRSLIIFNEIFTSTSSEDAAFLGARTLEEVLELGSLCVYVTFIDELAALAPAVVSMAARVSRDDPSARTYKVVRQRADGRAYATALAEKYALSYERLKERIAP